MLKNENKILDVINRQRHFAIFPIVCADHCAHLLKMNFAEVAYDGEKIAQVLEYGYNFYQYDMVLVFVDPYVEAEALGCKVEFNPYPRLLRSSELIGKNFIKGAHFNSSKNRTGEIIKAAKILKNRIDVPVFVSIKGPFSLASFIAGIDSFLRMLLKDEKKAKTIIDLALQFQLDYLERLFSIGVNIFIGDPLASCSVISSKIFEQFAFEPIRRLVNKIKEKGFTVGIHICGETKPILSMLDSLNADILSIEDIRPETKTLKMGGVKTDTILNGDQEKIKYEIKEALKHPYLILSTSCDVPIETKPESIKAIIAFQKRSLSPS